ncbi:MAG TPA: hypothetical protein VNK23_02405 [Candidatus Dormibacteraeota bacterium]|nr:hypothetical protein [Candidatus Dormibacteraeota bacterium]
MEEAPFRVLLLGENEAGWAGLRTQLQNRGWHCQFARSPIDARSLDGRRAHDLILTSLSAAQIEPFIAELGNVNSNVFYCHPVDDGCWWLPVVRHGRYCFGAPAARGSEFLAVLDQIIRDSRTQTPTPASLGMESNVAPAPRAGRAAGSQRHSRKARRRGHAAGK